MGNKISQLFCKIVQKLSLRIIWQVIEVSHGQHAFELVFKNFQSELKSFL